MLESAKMPTIGTSGNLTGTYLFFMIGAIPFP